MTTRSTAPSAAAPASASPLEPPPPERSVEGSVAGEPPAASGGTGRRVRTTGSVGPAEVEAAGETPGVGSKATQPIRSK